MPLWKTPSGVDKIKIQPKVWTYVKFENDRYFPLSNGGWSLVEVMLRVEYPKTGCPKTLRGKFVRFPGTAFEDETGNNDVDPIIGATRHHHWQHFLINQGNMTLGFRVWHDGSSPIVIDGRQFKAVAFTPSS